MITHQSHAPTTPPPSSASAGRFSPRSRWPERAGYAAAAWSLIYGLLGLWWALDGAGFSFGENDPRAGEVGSLFGTATPAPTGAAIAGLGLLGGGVALLMARPSPGPMTRLPLAFAWAMSAVLIVAVPDIRVAQNFAYLFFAYTGLWDRPLFFMLFCMAGGSLWAATAVAYSRRIRQTCEHCGRRATDGGPQSAARWGRWATYTAVVLALPYPVVRIAWGLGLPLGVPDGSLSGSSLGLRVGESVLGGLFIGGAVLTLGLIRRWGEVFPRWIPLLRGKRVPVWLAVVPAAWAAVVMSQAGLRIVLWTAQGEASITADTWGMGGPGLFWLPWGIALGAATYAYYLRRRGRCGRCGRGGDAGLHATARADRPTTKVVGRTTALHTAPTAKQPVPRWATAAAIAVPLCILPSAAWRVSHVIGVWLRGQGPCHTVAGPGEGMYLISLSVISMAAACLTLGLVRPWGEVFPRWMPFVGGRVVPVRLVTVIAVAGATLIALILIYGIVVRLVAPDWTVELIPPGCSRPGREVGLYYLPLNAWPLLLYLLTYHYYRRRAAPAAASHGPIRPRRLSQQ